MNTSVGRARIGQWYVREGKGEIFLVTGYDESARTIEIQTFDGDLDEIDLRTWTTLLLEFAETPEDWTGPIDDVRFDDLGCSHTELSAADWFEPLQPFRASQQVLEETADDDESGPLSEGVPTEELVPAEAPGRMPPSQRSSSIASSA
jgi:hypothetical protein